MPALTKDSSLPVSAPFPVAPERSMLRACLDRLAAIGLEVVVQAPADARTFARGLQRFPDRRIDASAHVRWDTAYRVFCGCARQPHDRGSWRILVADTDGRVYGALTARFFCGEFVRPYLHAFCLLESAAPVFREHCERAIGEVFATAQQQGRTPAEISHAEVARRPQAPLVAASLMRAMAALAAGFPAPLAIISADHHRSDVARLLRFGAAPLCEEGRLSLPPFVHHPSGAWLRLLLIDGPTFQTNCGVHSARDLAVLRARCPIISAA